MACNVDFTPTFLDYAQIEIPSYMQGHSLRPVYLKMSQMTGRHCHHRYWMHGDPHRNAYAHYGIVTIIIS